MKLMHLKVTFRSDADISDEQFEALSDKLDDIYCNIESYAQQMAAELPFGVTVEVTD